MSIPSLYANTKAQLIAVFRAFTLAAIPLQPLVMWLLLYLVIPRSSNMCPRWSLLIPVLVILYRATVCSDATSDLLSSNTVSKFSCLLHMLPLPRGLSLSFPDFSILVVFRIFQNSARKYESRYLTLVWYVVLVAWILRIHLQVRLFSWFQIRLTPFGTFFLHHITPWLTCRRVSDGQAELLVMCH